MKKSSFFLGGALLLSTLFLTSCDKVMSKLDNPVSSYLEVGKADVVIPTGDTYQIEASTISTMPIMYESSNPEVATVDADGLVTAIADGEATITVTVEQDANKAYLAGEQKINVAVKRPLTFEALEDGQINVSFNYGITLEKPIVYTINGGTKQEITATTSIAVTKGDKVEFESANDHTAEYGTYGSYNRIKFVNIRPQSQCAVYGNVMSMISPDGNYHTNKTITSSYALACLLCGYYNNTDDIYCTVSHDKYDLVLPATTLNDYCYYGLLYYTGITKAPELPAEELTPYCYAYMFENCQSLETAPELRAKELKDYCYYQMFRNCTKLSYLKCLAKNTEYRSVYCMLWNAGTDESVTTRTLERDPDTFWSIIPMGYVSSYSLYVNENWTITPTQEAASAPARRACASVEVAPTKDNTPIMPDAGAQDRPHVQF